MRLALLISVPIVVPAMVAAQQLTPGAEIPLTPPGYKMLRFDENYSYLTNQANRTDLFDPVKYIPLRQDDPLWYATFAGELRERYEGHYDPPAQRKGIVNVIVFPPGLVQRKNDK